MIFAIGGGEIERNEIKISNEKKNIEDFSFCVSI
jgi:hypothetical protein